MLSDQHAAKLLQNTEWGLELEAGTKRRGKKKGFQQSTSTEILGIHLNALTTFPR